ncbi:hypothetical protein HMPREF9997_02520 [Corynebacterium durum F0235]|uniref:Uncharacterized protein n=1 Tax=Corynebacterium durum F0235 TaxID=1035195 RepID=L1M929_9CORY|nr:hypothetical protein HMPREF9997_02520 [Corynebacterium durum F0235]
MSPHNNHYNIQYDHCPVLISAGATISTQSFTFKNTVFFIGALTTAFQPPLAVVT